jgi:hypothetical protein
MRHAALVTAVLGIAGCTTHGKAEITEAAFEDGARRVEILEATLRVLDAQPRYVDELFQLALRHPRTFERLLANTAGGLADRDLAELVARQLVAHPRGLERVMIETLDAAKTKPKAQAAIVGAIQERAAVAADFLVERPEQLAIVSKAIIQRAIDDPDTKDKMKTMLAELIE